jgi:hypothetical protein
VIAGHFGFAAIVKSREPQVPLWSLMLATVWLDVIFVPLFLTGVETLHPVPGLAGGYGANLIFADYTHSLLGALALSVVFALLFVAPWGRRCAIVLGLVAFSHWLLDLIVHRHDMPLLPEEGSHLPRLGFGLWRFPTASISIELLLVILGAWLYWRAARVVAAERTGTALCAALLIAIAGGAVLALDVTGALG